ncbi:hypothetical protein FRC01_005207 [Tulasnella sp. 417]|nr:hypothetical protein FRC01_005207 [Tulasnella sp. 417]
MQRIDWNKVAINLQGVAVDTQGSIHKLKSPPLPPPPAQPGNSNAAADKDASVEKFKCKMCAKSNRQFLLAGLRAHARVKHGITNLRVKDMIRV